MGSEISLNILVIGGRRTLIEKLFPKRAKNELKLPNSKEKRILEDKGIYWEANIYEDFKDEETMEKCLEEIYKYLNTNKDNKGNKVKISKKNVLLYFVNQKSKEYIDSIIINLNEIDRPHLIYVSNKEEQFENIENIDKKLLFPIIINNSNDNEYISRITKTLWERDCYWNERGNKIQYPLSEVDDIAEIQNQTLINILIIGEARSGKSTFINTIFDNYVSKELPCCSSVTTKINEYIYKNKIKFIDTPGIIKNDKLDTIDKVIDEIKETFAKYKNSKDQIHIIYYFLSKISDLENSRKVFEYLAKLKKEKKIPIIFIINGDINKKNEINSSLIEGFKHFLFEKTNKKNISILYDGNKEESETPKNNRSFLAQLKSVNGNSNNIDKNIIKINLIEKEDKYAYSYKYGIDKVFEKTIEYLENSNDLKSKYFQKINEINTYFNNYIEKKTKDQLTKEDETTYEKNKKVAKDLIKEISEKNTLFNQMDCIDNLLIGAGSKASYTIISISLSAAAVSFIPVPFLDIPIVLLLQAVLMVAIGMIYGFNSKNIPYGGLLTAVLGGGAIDVGVSTATVAVKVGGGAAANKIATGVGVDIVHKATLPFLSKTFGEETLRQLTGRKLFQEIAKLFGKQAAQSATAAETSKFIPLIGSVIGGIIGGSINGFSTYGIGKAAQKFFESLLKTNCGASYICTNHQIFIEIFEEINNLKRRFTNS